MQLHAVRGRAVALICGRPNSKNSRLGFELLPFSTRREGPRRPLVTRREEWNANSSPRLNKTGSEAGAACLYCLRSCNTDDEWPPEGSEVHIQCHRNISARTGARRAFAAEQSVVLPQPHEPPRSASPTRAQLSTATMPCLKHFPHSAPRPQARRAALRRARARPGRRAAPRRRAAARDGVRGRRGAGGRRRRAGAGRDLGVGPRLAAAAPSVRGVAHHRGDRRHRAGRVAVEVSPFC